MWIGPRGTTSAIMLLTNVAFAAVDMQQTSPAPPACPGDDVVITCTVTLPLTLQVYLLWWQNLQDPQDQQIYHIDTTSAAVSSVAGFTTEFVEGQDGVIVSTATLMAATAQDNGTTEISCRDNLGNWEDLAVRISGAPGPPSNAGSLALSFSSVLLTWDPPLHSYTNCPPVAYALTITATCTNPYFPLLVTVNTSTNASSEIVSGLFQEVEYSFTVAGIDTGGRIGERSSLDVFTLGTLPAVVALAGSVPDDMGTILITWQPPLPSSRPPVTGYKISHNTTGSVLINQTSNTTFTVKGVASGVYLFTVLAVNALGDGEEESITVTSLSSQQEGFITSFYQTSSLYYTASILKPFPTITSHSCCSPTTNNGLSSHQEGFITSFYQTSLLYYTASVLKPSPTITNHSCCSSTTSNVNQESGCIDPLALLIGLPITALVCSLVSSLVTAQATYFIMRRRGTGANLQTINKATEAIYDTPQITTVLDQEFTINDNVAYGYKK